MTTPETAPVEVKQADEDHARSIASWCDVRSPERAKVYKVARDILARQRAQVERETLARHRLTPRQDGLREALDIARNYVVGNHDEGCELDLEYGEQNFDDEDGVRNWPEDRKCTCGTEEILAKIDAALSDISPLANEDEPVALLHVHEGDGEREVELYNHGAGCITDADKAAGWTETPLYARPLANDTGALREALAKITPIVVENGPEYASVHFGDGETHRSQTMTMNPQDWLDIQAALCRRT